MNTNTSAILSDFTLSFTPSAPKYAPCEPSKPGDGLSVRERRDLNRSKWTSTPLDIDFIENNGVTLCGMKRLGISHIRDEKPCQDSFRLFCDDTLGVSIIVAADGHGDKKHDLSQFGSAFACSALTATVLNAIREKCESEDSYFKSAAFKEDIIKEWNYLVLEYHKNNFPNDNETPSQILTRYGTTLLFAFHYLGKFYVGRLGDGGIILSAKDNSYTLFAGDDKLGTSTCSMCMENSHMLLNVKVYSDSELDSVMLMTDGMFDIFTEERYLFDNMKEFLSGTESNAEERNEHFGALYNKYVEYITDDATVCLLTKKDASQSVADAYFDSVGIDPYSIVYREHSIKARYRIDGIGYIAIFSKHFLPEEHDSEELFGFINPIKTHIAGDYVCNIYPDNGADDYKNIYSLFDDMIKKRRTGIADDKVISITNCLLPFILSNEPAFNTSSRELLSELIEYSETDGCVRIFSFCERNEGSDSYQSVMAQLLISIIAGSITDASCITNTDIDNEIPLPERSDIINSNLMRAGKSLLRSITAVAKGEYIPDSGSHYITNRCKSCGNIIWTYKNITLCPHCRAQLIPQAVISSELCGIYEYICAGTTIAIHEKSIDEAPVLTTDAVRNPTGGQLGLKNSGNSPWQFPGESVTIQPGQIKGILKDTVLRINDTDFNISLLK